MRRKERIFWSTPDRVFQTAHTEWLRCATVAFSTACAVHIEDWGWLVVVQLSWLSGRALLAQARGPIIYLPLVSQLSRGIMTVDQHNVLLAQACPMTLKHLPIYVAYYAYIIVLVIKASWLVQQQTN